MTPTPRQITSDPQEFARVFLKILRVGDGGSKELIPFRWNHAQQHFHANRTGRDLILKARQLGFTTFIQGEMYRRTVTGTRTTITLAHDSDTTAKIRLMADRFHEHCQYNGIQPARKYANASMTTYPEFDSVVAIATAGSLNTGRGDTYTDFHGSEVAIWPDAEEIIAGALQGGDPDAILESTPNGAQGYFYSLCMDALAGKGPWKLHFYPWWWDVRYRLALEPGETLEYTDDEAMLVAAHKLTPEQIKWRRRKQSELRRKFKQEYPEDPVSCFLTPDESAIYLRDWWDGKNRYDAGDRNAFARTVARWISFDTALKDAEQNDTTAMCVFDLDDEYILRLRLVWWKRLQFPQLAKVLMDEIERWNYDEKLRGIIIEDKASGISALQTLQQGLPENISRLLIPFNPGIASKTARGRNASLWCERDCILLPAPGEAAPWLFDFENILFNSPAVEIDDPADAFSQAVLYLEHLLAEGWKLRTGGNVP